ncbi:filamentation protein (plasmid) [Sinorhizobium americanum CCGM7]|nr:hypothetical protein [Sinorhizobium americanum]APG86714.1 filamentation protein [Sinorhizobium americanum CCGM7]
MIERLSDNLPINLKSRSRPLRAGGFLLSFAMADERPKGSYTYPNTSDDPDRTNVLKNRWGIETHSELRVKEYRATAVRMAEIAEGDARKASTKLT